jgi:hypothetical protein
MATHTVLVTDLPEGDRGIDTTVGYMLAFIRAGARHPVVRKIAASIDQTTPERAVRGAIREVMKHMYFQLDPTGEELVRAPWVSLASTTKGPGDCDCMTIALGALCVAMKIPCWVKVIDWRQTGDFTHVFLLAEARPGWAIPVDATEPLPFGNERWPQQRQKVYKVN